MRINSVSSFNNMNSKNNASNRTFGTSLPRSGFTTYGRTQDYWPVLVKECQYKGTLPKLTEILNKLKNNNDDHILALNILPDRKDEYYIGHLALYRSEQDLINDRRMFPFTNSYVGDEIRISGRVEKDDFCYTAGYKENWEYISGNSLDASLLRLLEKIVTPSKNSYYQHFFDVDNAELNISNYLEPFRNKYFE